MNSGLMSHQQRGHTETGSWFTVSSERLEKRGIELAIPGLDKDRTILCEYAPEEPSTLLVDVMKGMHLTPLIVSEQCKDDTERLYAMKRRLTSRNKPCEEVLGN